MTTKERFLQKGIVKGKETTALELFNTVCPDFTVLKNKRPQDQLKIIWDNFKKIGKVDNSANGKVFEYALISIFINENILPLYVQAKIAFVPNVDFDLLLYSKNMPIALSLKTSLRERYKQADLEAIALKYVHRKAKVYLLTISEHEAKGVNAKILTGDVIGIDNVIYCFSEEFDHLVYKLGQEDFCEAGHINIINALSLIQKEKEPK